LSTKATAHLKSLFQIKNTQNKKAMDYISYTEKLSYLLEMIEKGQLLSLKQVSEKFECSERTIQRMINILREQGYQIIYSKSDKKYFMKI